MACDVTDAATGVLAIAKGNNLAGMTIDTDGNPKSLAFVLVKEPAALPAGHDN